MKEFDIQTTPLEGINMLEASAGTGKTYSLGVLVLRMILEKNIPIEKILMVTFTNAAVAELELRIRSFVRQAYRYATFGTPCEKTIEMIVGKNEKDLPAPKMKAAVQSLDNLSVMTINSFCQKTIGEFTFETNQSFDYEIVTEDTFILKNATHRFVREYLNVLDYEQFSEIEKELKVEKMHELLGKHLQGMEFVDSKLDKDDTLDKVKKLIEKKNSEFDEFIKRKFPEIMAMGNKDALAKEAAAGNISEFKRRFNDQIKKPSKFFTDYAFLVDEFLKYQKAVEQSETELFNYFYLHFFQQSENQIKERKQTKGYISYNDQIKTIHAALQNDDFKERLSEKYDAIFIDEFQDTDKYQYEIFSEVFGGKTLFYIGDPKQSIYGWRGADLDTYKIAKDKAGENNIHTLGTNFRSTPQLLAALEKLMNPGNGFNMFWDEKIRFEPVASGSKNLGDMKTEGKSVAPITIWQFDTDDTSTSNAAVAQEVYNLLTGDATIKEEKIKPRDIGILVRGNKEGRELKQSLAAYNIPSVQRDDTKILESDEADRVRYIIEAALNPQRGEILRAINSHWFGFESKTMDHLDEQLHIEHFLKFRDVLQKEGVFNMISKFLDIYGVRQKCASHMLGQRVLTNIQQITEILHQLERKSKLLPEDLIVWMQRAKDDSNDEYQLRIESDDDAVQISTIHKAKGLQYKVVFAPGLCMIPKKNLLQKKNVNSYKKDGKYCFTFNYPGLPDEDKAIHDMEKEQENRRLIYVALTRAQYKCYLSYMPRTYRNKETESSFDDLFGNFDQSYSGIELIDFSTGKFEKTEGNYAASEYMKKTIISRTPKITSEDLKVPLQLHSFSALNENHYSTPFQFADLTSVEYDHFVFQQLARGANAGTALHSIFEHLHFNQPDTWEQTLVDAAKYYKGILKEEFTPHLKTMIEHTMKVDISINNQTIQLQNIDDRQKLPELMFNFVINNASKNRINDVLGDTAELAGNAALQGIMTGFVDLLFEYNGKYYILDWKSNYLGNHLSDYNEKALESAMKSNNYTLQYLIYTIAVNRWLKQRRKDFDYEKHFGGVIYLFMRGLRQGETTGIYTARPEKKLIDGVEELILG